MIHQPTKKYMQYCRHAHWNMHLSIFP